MVYKTLLAIRIPIIIIQKRNTMTEYEKEVIIQAIKRNAPDWYKRLKKRFEQKRKLILSCIEIASRSDNSYSQNEVNRIYNTCCSLMNKTEIYMLDYICLIKHKEQVNDGQNDDTNILRWVGYLQEFKNSTDSVISILDKQTRQIINQYRIKKALGRPKGSGKRIFSYNGKEYYTIQECADEYGISKQGMHKRLKKLHII